jgi:hypothetical protein
VKTYDFVIKLAGSVDAETYQQAEEKLNKHLDELGEIDSKKYDLVWPDASFDLERPVAELIDIDLTEPDPSNYGRG